MLGINWALKELVRETIYTPMKSSKAKKERHNYVENVCIVDFKVPQELSAE